jgi:hypothetical protein
MLPTESQARASSYEAVLKYAEPQAALLLRDGDAEPALRGHGVDQRAGHLGLLSVELVREG